MNALGNLLGSAGLTNGPGMTKWGMFITSIVLAVVAIVSLIYTSRHTDLLRKDLHTRLKPYLSFSSTRASHHFTMRDKVFIAFRIRNKGQLAARKVRAYYKEVPNDALEHIVSQKKEIKKNPVSLGTIVQNLEADFTVELNWGRPDYESTKLAIWFEYTYLDKIKEETIAIVEIRPESERLSHHWYIFEDIIEAESKKSPLATAQAL